MTMAKNGKIMENNVMRSRKYYAVLLFAVGAFVVCFFTNNRKRYYNDSGVVWTTEYHIAYEASDNLKDSIEAVLDGIDRSVSVFNKESLLSKINAGRTAQADEYFARLYATAHEMFVGSGGAYDPTVMPLVNAWGFGYKTGRVPQREEIDSMLAFVGMDKTSLNGGVLHKDDSRTMFDFSSIAKGMACDEVGRMLERNGVENYMVEIGGEVACRGVNYHGGVWHVSVDMPIENDTAVTHSSAVVLSIDSGGVATSGNYRNFKVVNGQKTAHIINPVTGYPQITNLLSVTVVARSCMLADAWATACMVMGSERVKKMMESDTHIGVMTISSDAGGNMVVWSNKAFADRVVR